MMDARGTGLVSQRDFEKALNKLGLKLPRADAKKVMRRFDRDGNGKLDYKEFLAFVRSGADDYGAGSRASLGGARHVQKNRNTTTQLTFLAFFFFFLPHNGGHRA